MSSEILWPSKEYQPDVRAQGFPLPPRGFAATLAGASGWYEGCRMCQDMELANRQYWDSTPFVCAFLVFAVHLLHFTNLGSLTVLFSPLATGHCPLVSRLGTPGSMPFSLRSGLPKEKLQRTPGFLMLYCEYRGSAGLDNCSRAASRDVQAGREPPHPVIAHHRPTRSGNGLSKEG